MRLLVLMEFNTNFEGGNSMGGSSTGGTQEKIGAQQRGTATYMRNMGQDKTSALYQMSTGQMTPYQQEMMRNQLAAVDQGQLGAAQQLEQTTREGATSRGLFSSRGAIAEEANQLANLPLQRSLQQAGIYQNMAGLQQQGILQGTALRGNLLSGAISGYGGASQSYQAAEQANQAQNQALMGGVLGAGRLAAGVMTGGVSEVALAGANAVGGQTGLQNFSQPRMGITNTSLSNYNPYDFQLGGRGNTYIR